MTAKADAKRILCWTVAMFFAIFWLLVTFMPFFYMVLNSFKGQFEMLRSGVFAMPKALDISNYRTVLAGEFWGYFYRSIIVTAVSLALMTAISALASYPLARLQFKSRSFIYGFMYSLVNHAFIRTPRLRLNIFLFL